MSFGVAIAVVLSKNCVMFCCILDVVSLRTTPEDRLFNEYVALELKVNLLEFTVFSLISWAMTDLAVIYVLELRLWVGLDNFFEVLSFFNFCRSFSLFVVSVGLRELLTGEGHMNIK